MPISSHPLSPPDQENNSMRVCAVVVTYNRLELLKAALAALRAQTRPLNSILVIDNGCTDDTGRWLASEFSRDPAGSFAGHHAI